MEKRHLLFSGALILGGILAGLGAAFVVMYVLEAVVARRGDPDQSLLFWYLPILFIGLVALAAGAGIGLWGWRRRREDPAAQPSDDGPLKIEDRKKLE
jgi:membrane protein implicated in regulation of membrane protease activity